MIRRLILPLLFLFSYSIFAQVEKSPCGAMAYSPAYLANHPEEEEKISKLEIKTHEWIAENQNAVSTRELITIPVVVHLVYNDDKFNFTDVEIQSQIDGLTADFTQSNSNQNIIPDHFKDRAANVEFEFCLATVTPDGIRTNGIERKQNTSIENIGTDKVFGVKRTICYTSEGGLDAWDTNHYLNIWVGEMESILGEATFPGMARVPEEDGVFIDVEAFGFFCSDETNFHLGRTLTHEVGHFFNLKHIFGDVEDCNHDDGVEDTPLQKMRNSGCISEMKTNTCDSGEVYEMTVNFMDYVDDECMAMFTNGQKMRMLAALNTYRSGLKNSIGCSLINLEPTTIVPDKITTFPNPASNCVHIDLGIDADFQVNIKFINTAGQRLLSERVYVKDFRSFDISNYPNGIYFLLIENGNNFASKKIIISK